MALYVYPSRRERVGLAANVKKPLSFRAPLERIWIQRCVNVPERISRALGGPTERIPVRGWIEDIDIQSTLTPRGGGRHRLVVPSRIWRPLKLDAGDHVTVALFRDEKPAQFPIPLEFAQALAEDYEAKRAFEELTPAMRRQVANFIAAAKRPETREKRIAQLLERLRTRKLHSS